MIECEPSHSSRPTAAEIRRVDADVRDALQDGTPSFVKVLLAYEERPDGGYLAEGQVFDGSDCTVYRVEDAACGGPYTEFWLHGGPLVFDHERTTWIRPTVSREEFAAMDPGLRNPVDAEPMPLPFRPAPRLPGFGPTSHD